MEPEWLALWALLPADGDAADPATAGGDHAGLQIGIGEDADDVADDSTAAVDEVGLGDADGAVALGHIVARIADRWIVDALLAQEALRRRSGPAC